MNGGLERCLIIKDDPKKFASDALSWGHATLLGALTAASGLSIIMYFMANSDIFASPVVRAVQFSPLWLSGIIGWVIASTPLGLKEGARQSVLTAALLAVPVALLDPWALVALRMGAGVPVTLKVFILMMPVLLAAVFAYPPRGSRGAVIARRISQLLIMLVATGATYYVIYEVLLPT